MDNDRRSAARNYSQADDRGSVDVTVQYMRTVLAAGPPDPRRTPGMPGGVFARRAPPASSVISDVAISIKLDAHGDFGPREMQLSGEEFMLIVGAVRRVLPRTAPRSPYGADPDGLVGAAIAVGDD